VLLAVAGYPLIFAVLPTTYYYGEPRYLDFLWPLLALIGGWALARVRWPAVQALVVVALLAVTANGVLHLTRLAGPPGKAFEDMSPHPVAPLVAALDDEGIDRVFADYWVAYRMTWETDERIVASPLGLVRSPEHDRTVRSAVTPAYVVVAGSCVDDRLRQGLATAGVTFTVRRADDWAVIVPSRRALPEDVVPELC
jgi:hypothetical protein